MDGQTEVATIPEEKPDALMAVVAELARAGNIDAVKEMIKMRNDELARVAKLAFMAAFIEMKPHLKKIENKHLNSQTKSKYAKLEDINREIDPVLERYGFATSTPIVSQSEKEVTVKAILIHKGGHSEETLLSMPWDKAGIQGSVNKTDPHALASSIKYARRIAVCAIVNLSTGDGQDKDGNSDSSVIDIEKAAEIDNLIRTSGANRAAFLKYMGVEDVRDILSGDYKKAIDGLKKKAKDNHAA